MRVLFMGTSDFAVPSLEALLGDPDFQVTSVVTQVDRPRDRGYQIKFSPIKGRALKAGIPILQPLKVRSEEVRPVLEKVDAEVIVVAAYGQILPEWLLHLKKFGAINVHASLLPRHRGAAPIQRAILEGDRHSGITIMQMDVGLDTGPILFQQSTPIGSQETAGELHDRLAQMGAELLLESLRRVQDGTLKAIPQDVGKATQAAKIRKEEAFIDWSMTAEAIHNRVRAFNPWPGCTTFFCGQELKIWRAFLSSLVPDSDQKHTVGTLKIEKNNHLLVLCGDHRYLELIELNLPGRKRISGSDLIHGRRLQSGIPLTSPLNTQQME